MEILQASSTLSAGEAEQKGQPKRKKSVHYHLDLENPPSTDGKAKVAHPLEHPGSKSAPPVRPRTTLDLTASHGRRSVPASMRDDPSSSSTDGSDDEIPDEETPTGSSQWWQRDSMGAYYDQPTPALNIDDAIAFTTVFGPTADKHAKKLPTSEAGDGESRWRKRKQKRRCPEQRITLFAFRLAMIEKAASSIGTMAFLWATVVILGGFASTITFANFWVVTAIIVAEAARIFNRSHELEWQNFSTKSSESGLFTSFMKSARESLGRNPTTSKTGHHVSPNEATNMRALGINITSNPKKMRLVSRHGLNKAGYDQRVREVRAPDSPHTGRTWSRRNVPILPYVSNVMTSKAVSQTLYILQVCSAVLCIALSFWRLERQDFCDRSGNGCDNYRNVLISMNVFYSLAVVEAALFLLEKGYLECRMRSGLLKMVRREVCHGRLGDAYDTVISSFFYNVYHQCLEGSVFDGLDMDLVTFGIQWLQSEHSQQQLFGAKLLNQLVSGHPHEDPLTGDALRRLGTTPGVIERLVEMLSWNSQEEEELLYEVALIISGLVAYERNCSRIVAVPGALDAIVSLLILYASTSYGDSKISKEATERMKGVCLTSLKILKYLSRTHKNSQKIGDTRGLLAILVIFIQIPAGARQGLTDSSGWKVHKKSLQVLSLLAAATNTSGEVVRQSIARIVSGLKNLRDIIEVCDERPDLQLLAMKILHNLALEDDVRSSIGTTSGTLRLLFHIFQQNDAVREALEVEDNKVKKNRMKAVEKAGELLARLSLQNESNCLRLLNLKCIEQRRSLAEVMVEALKMQERVATSAAGILRNVLKYTDEGTRRDISVSCAPTVMENILVNQHNARSVLYQVYLGLASCTIGFIPLARYREAFSDVDKVKFVAQLFRNLKHTPTTKKFPRVRRYSVELSLALIGKDNYFLDTFDAYSLDIKTALEEALESISEVENYILFSGLIGYAKHTESMEQLIMRCIGAVERYHTNNRLKPTSPSKEEVFS